MKTNSRIRLLIFSSVVMGLGIIANVAAEEEFTLIKDFGTDSYKRETTTFITSLKNETNSLRNKYQEYKKTRSVTTLKELQDIARARKHYLIETMRRDPNTALNYILSKEERLKLEGIAKGYIEKESTVAGTLEVTIIDDFEREKAETIYTLITQDNQEIILHPNREISFKLSGATVKATGLKIENHLLFDPNGPVFQLKDKKGLQVLPAVSERVLAIGEEKLATILIDSQDSRLPADMRSIMNDLLPQVARYFEKVSDNAVYFTRNDLFGPYRIPIDSNGFFNEQSVIDAADPDMDFRQYSKVIVVAPSRHDGLNGLATSLVGDSNEGRVFLRAAFIYGVRLSTILHELGHLFGLGHAQGLSCGESPIKDIGCDTAEYGNPYSIMGRGRIAHLTAPELDSLGWFKPSNIQEVSESGIYNLEPIERPTDNLKAIKIPTFKTPILPQGYYDYIYVEYRQPVDIDLNINQGYMHHSDVFEGALIHLNGGLIIDPSIYPHIPGEDLGFGYSSTISLKQGETFTEPFTGTTITVVSRTPELLTLRVNFSHISDQTAPSISNEDITTDKDSDNVSGAIKFNLSPFDPETGISMVKSYFELGKDLAHRLLVEPFGEDKDMPFEAVLETTNLPNGLNSIYFLSFNKSAETLGGLGNFSRHARLIKVSNQDSNPPQITSLRVFDKSYPGFVEVDASDDNKIWKVEFYDAGRLVYIDYERPYRAALPLIPGEGGTGMVIARAYDMALNIAESQPANYRLPASLKADGLWITNPLDGAIVRGEIPLSIELSQNLQKIGVLKAEYYLAPKDDKQQASFIGISKESPFSVFWDSNTVADGDYFLSAKAVFYTESVGYTGGPYIASLSFPIRITVNNTGEIISPAANFTASPLVGEAPLTVQFIDRSTSQNEITSWFWDFGDGNVSSQQNPTHLYSRPGRYTISLAVSDFQEKTNTKIKSNYITVFLADTTPPSVSIIEPRDGAELRGSIIIKASASDNVGINRIEFSIDSNSPFAFVKNQPYEVTWDAGTVSNDFHTIKAKAYDDAGNSREDTITVNVNVNRTPQLNPIGNKIVNEGELLTFTVSATDINGDNLSLGVMPLPPFPEGISFSKVIRDEPGLIEREFSWRPDFSQSGTYRMRFTVSDGKVSVHEWITVTVNDMVDITPPAIPMVTDEGEFTTRKDQLSCSWSSEDPESGIAEYQYAIGTLPGAVDVADWKSAGVNTSVTETSLNLQNGKTYYFSVKAKNGVGLWSEVGYSDGITVDSSAPVITHASKTRAQKGRPIVFRAKVSDTGSGIENVWVELTYFDGSQEQLPMTKPLNKNYYQAVLPRNKVKKDITYSLKAKDKAGNVATVGPYRIRVK